VSPRGDKKERTVLVAAFLLFAAGLCLVRPAEASRTTNARLSLASSSSLELASLGLPMLEPIEPADSASISSRFGFAEDLGLLDSERRPGGFVVFAAEAAQCALTYARNNPVTFTDPDGRMANLIFGFIVKKMPGSLKLAKGQLLNSADRIARALGRKGLKKGTWVQVEAELSQKEVWAIVRKAHPNTHPSRLGVEFERHVVTEGDEALGLGMKHAHPTLDGKRTGAKLLWGDVAPWTGIALALSPWESAEAADSSDTMIPAGYQDPRFTSFDPSILQEKVR